MTKELMKKFKRVKSVEELKKVANENNITLSDNDAQVYFDRISQVGELSDEELDNVSGGAAICDSISRVTMNGVKYVIVTTGCTCFTDQYKRKNGIEYTGINIEHCGNCEHFKPVDKSGIRHYCDCSQAHAN